MAGRAAPADDVPDREDFRKLAGQQPLARASMHTGPRTATKPRAFVPCFITHRARAGSNPRRARSSVVHAWTAASKSSGGQLRVQARHEHRMGQDPAGHPVLPWHLRVANGGREQLKRPPNQPTGGISNGFLSVCPRSNRQRRALLLTHNASLAMRQQLIHLLMMFGHF